jgi:hypothetical protein
MTNSSRRRYVSTQVRAPMAKNELAVEADGDPPDGRYGSGAAPAGFISEEFWCSVMGKEEAGVGARKSASVAAEPVCGKLRLMFEDAATEPMPDVLACLFDRLETALERGELFAAKTKAPRG